MLARDSNADFDQRPQGITSCRAFATGSGQVVPIEELFGPPGPVPVEEGRRGYSAALISEQGLGLANARFGVG